MAPRRFATHEVRQIARGAWRALAIR